MKANKMLYLDIEVIEFLNSQKQASKLVNALLLDEMDKESLESMSLDELKREKQAREILKQAEKKALDMRNGN